MTKTGRNDPCPCGSGKKYKKCCLEQDEEARRVADDGEAGGADETSGLTERLDWPAFDFGIDPYDPFIDDLLFGPPADENDPEGEDDDEIDDEEEDERVGACLAPAAYRFVRGETRARLLEELERRVVAAGLTEDPIARRAIDGVADESASPMALSFVRELFAGGVEDVQERRCRVDDEEETGLDEALVEEALAGATAADLERTAAFALRLGPMREGAVPYVEECLISAPMGERAIPLLGFLSGFPSVRSLSLALFALATDPTGSVRDAVFDVFSTAPRAAWPMLLYFCHVRWRPADERLAAYEVLVRAGEPEVVFCLTDEFDVEAVWNEPMPDAGLEPVADLLARLGDRRAIGRLLRLGQMKHLRKGARRILERAFERAGWAEEFRAAQDRLARRERVLVEHWDEEDAGEDGDAEVYVEHLDWLRPADVPVPGPEETKLGKEFATWLAERIGEDAELEEDELERHQEEWMMTRAADGRIPMAVIQAERDRDPPHPGFARDRREWLLSDLYREARQALEEADVPGARRRLETLLEIEPEHPFGRRLARRLPSD